MNEPATGEIDPPTDNTLLFVLIGVGVCLVFSALLGAVWFLQSKKSKSVDAAHEMANASIEQTEDPIYGQTSFAQLK